jgi:hypothetical protein
MSTYYYETVNMSTHEFLIFLRDKVFAHSDTDILGEDVTIPIPNELVLDT